MKKKLIVLSLFICCLAAYAIPSPSASLAQGAAPMEQVSPYLTPQAAQQKMRDLPSLFLLDVRSPEEFTQGHAPGATLIPLPELPSRVAELPSDRPILVYCRSGKRAAKAYDVIKAARPDLKELFVINGAPIY